VGVEARRTRGSSILTCAEGKESPREEPDCYGKLARVSWEKLWRKAELEKVRAWISAFQVRHRRRKTTESRKRQNGRVVSLTRYGDTVR
jgi:hypothetical protein